MAIVRFEALKDFDIRISGQSRQFKVGEFLDYNTSKKNEYFPKIGELKDRKIIRDVPAEQQVTQTESQENASLPANIPVQKKSSWSFKRTFGLDDTAEAGVTQKNHDNQDTSTIIDSIGQLIETRHEQINNNVESLKRTQLDIKMELGDINVTDEVKRIATDLDEIKGSLKDYNADINQIIQGKQQINQNVDEKFQTIKQGLVLLPTTNLIRNELEHTVRKIKDDHIIALSSLNQTSGKLSQQTAAIQTSIADVDDKVQSATRGLKKSMEETREAVEALQGKANVLDDLKNKLDKVNISAKLSPFNHEDDVILELFEQGQLVMEQLMLASRHYVAQRHNMKQMEAENAKLKQELDLVADSTTKAVEQRVRNEVTRQMTKVIADAFVNLDDVYEEEKLAGVQALLLNNGIIRSLDYKVGYRIRITDDTRESFEARIDFDYTGEGEYQVTQSLFLWKDNQHPYKKAVATRLIAPAIIEEPVAEHSTEEAAEQPAEQPAEQVPVQEAMEKNQGC